MNELFIINTYEDGAIIASTSDGETVFLTKTEYQNYLKTHENECK
jgi:hypothetical protein